MLNEENGIGDSPVPTPAAATSPTTIPTRRQSSLRSRAHTAASNQDSNLAIPHAETFLREDEHRAPAIGSLPKRTPPVDQTTVVDTSGIKRPLSTGPHSLSSPTQHKRFHPSPAEPWASPSSKKSGRNYDRFIPDRTSIDYSTAFMLSTEPFGSPKKKKGTTTETDAAKEEANRTYSKVLKNELFGSAYESTAAFNDGLTSPTKALHRSSHGLGSPTKLLHFRPPKSARKLDFGEPLNLSKYALSPVNIDSHQVLASPRKIPRHIPKVPFKVLDAPDLADDFYLNLVDWGASNLLSVGLGSCVYLWSAHTSRVTKLCDIGPYDTVTSVNWMQRGSHIAIGTNRGLVQIWDASDCKKIRSMSGHSARVGTLAWNDHLLSSGSRDRLIFHRDVRSPSEHIKKLSGHKQEVCGLKWNHEKNQLASGGNDNRLLVWDRLNEQPTLRFADHMAAIKAIAWSPHQHGLLASGGGTADRRIRFWNTLTGTPLHAVDTGSQVCNLAWSRNANEIVSTHGYSQNQIVVWKYPSMQQLATLTGHTFRVLYLAVSPDGQTVVTGAGDETLRFWNVFNKCKDRNEAKSVLTGTTTSIR